MKRRQLWKCKRCPLPLGEVVSDDLRLYARNILTFNAAQNLFVVICACGWLNIWVRSKGPLDKAPAQ